MHYCTHLALLDSTGRLSMQIAQVINTRNPYVDVKRDAVENGPVLQHRTRFQARKHVHEHDAG